MRQQDVPLRPHIARPPGLGQKSSDTLGTRNIPGEDGDRPHGEREDSIRRPAELGHHRVGAGGVVRGIGLQRS